DRQLLGAVGKALCELLIDGDAVTRTLATMQAAVAKEVVVRKNLIRLPAVAHVLLDTEVGNPGVEVQRRTQRDRREIGGAVKSGPHLVHCREIGNAAHMGDTAGMHESRADEVDEPALDEALTIPD